MLRITFQATADGTTFKLEGELDRLSVRDMERLWYRLKERGLHRPVRVQLTSVLPFGEDGKRMLSVMHEDGVELVADDPLIRSMLEEVRCGERSAEVRERRLRRHAQPQ